MKNDKIDARNLALYLKGGLLQLVQVPDIDLEEDRDLVRLKDIKMKNVVKGKLRIKSFLLRKGIDYDHEKTWSKKFFDWLGTMELSSKDRFTLNRLLNDLNYSIKFVKELEEDIFEVSQSNRYRDIAHVLCGFRGIQTNTAMMIATNIVDFRTFSNPKSLASFVGVTLGFNDSGETKRGLGITKQGNNMLRKAFVNAAQHYMKTGTTGTILRVRRQRLSSNILNVVQRCAKNNGAKVHFVVTGN